MTDYEKTPLNKVVRGAIRASYDVAAINEILDAGFLGQVSYIYQDNAISLPMSYGHMDNKIYLHGSLKNRMLNALLEAKKASMTIMHLDGLVLARSAFHHSANYRSATLFCSVAEITSPEEKLKAFKAIINQMVPNRWDSLRPVSDKEIKSTLVLKLTIETASAKIRSVGVIDEKADLDYPVWAGVIPIKQIALAAESDTLLADDIAIPKHVEEYIKSSNTILRRLNF